MAATTPYQQNDYQASSNYRPYQLPVNDIFRALQAQNQFWEEGARHVKSVYDNALNLKLSLEPNRDIRKRFMEEAEKQLTKLSSMDLSDPSVQKQGFDIFKPLFQDKGVMSDDQATRWIDDVQGDIQRAREMDNGKGYADSNAMVAMEGVYEFKNAKDRFAGMQYLQNKRSYTPYYDPGKEMQDLLKNCKGPTIASTVPGAQGEMYLHTQEVSGASPSRVQSCLNAGLSARAKDQLGIDGYAAYMTNNRMDHPDGKNYQALRDDYLSSHRATLDSVTQDIKDMDGKITAYQNAYNQTKDVRYLEMKKAAETARGNYLDQAKNLNDAFTQLSSGNLDFIRKNYGPLAEQLYTKKQLGLFGEAFRNDVNIEKYSADAARLQQQRLVYDEAKQKAQFKQDEKMAEINFGYDIQLEALKGTLRGQKLDKNGNVVEELIPTNPAFIDEDKVSSGFDEFNKERVGTTKAIDDINSELFNTLKRKYPKEMEAYPDVTSFFTPGPNGVSAALSFLDTSGRVSDDVAVQDWSRQSALLTNKLNLLKGYEDASELEVRKAVPNAFDRESIRSKFPPITLSDGTVVTTDQVLDALEGRPSPLGIIPGSSSTGASPTTGATSGTYTPGAYIVNGRAYQTTYGSRDAKLHSFVRDIRDRQMGNISDINKKRDEVYGRAMLQIRPDVYADANNIDKTDPTRNNILAAIPGQFDLQDIKIISKDPTTGWATISIKGNDKINVSSNDVLKRLTALSPADEPPRIEEGKNEAVIRYKSPHLIDQRTLSNPLTMLQLNLEKLSLAVTNPLSPYSQVQAGQLITSLPITTQAYKGTDFQVDIIRTMGGVKYEVLSKQKNNVTSADGTITQEKGKYYPTGQVFSNTNQLLEYLNGTQQNSLR